jgi:hypothetical protein
MITRFGLERKDNQAREKDQQEISLLRMDEIEESKIEEESELLTEEDFKTDSMDTPKVNQNIEDSSSLAIMNKKSMSRKDSER